MLEKHTGIILKTYFPQKRKIAILDCKLGKIEAVPADIRLGVGSLIEYYARPQGKIYFLESVQVLDVPLRLGKTDILFLHHVLEICYFGVPFGSCVSEIFDMVDFLYALSEPIEYHYKIAFIFKLLTTIGIYPYESRFQQPLFYNLAIESIDSIAVKSLDLKVQQELHSWIYAGISEHPLVKNFKTINFLIHDRMA